MKAIIYPNNGALPDLPNDRLRITFFGETDQAATEHAAHIVPDGVPFLIIDKTDVPSDRTYRDAWEADFSEPNGAVITINAEKKAAIDARLAQPAER
jgi:hypothetical protein